MRHLTLKRCVLCPALVLVVLARGYWPAGRVLAPIQRGGGISGIVLSFGDRCRERRDPGSRLRFRPRLPL